MLESSNQCAGQHPAAVATQAFAALPLHRWVPRSAAAFCMHACLRVHALLRSFLQLPPAGGIQARYRRNLARNRACVRGHIGAISVLDAWATHLPPVACTTSTSSPIPAFTQHAAQKTATFAALTHNRACMQIALAFQAVLGVPRCGARGKRQGAPAAGAHVLALCCCRW